MVKKRWREIFLGVILSGALLFLFMQFFSSMQVIKSVQNMIVGGIVFGGVLYLISVILRALRAWWLLEKKISLSALIVLTTHHSFFTAVLPARTGDLSYLVLVKNQGISLREGVLTLLLARLLDVFALLIFTFGSLLVVSSQDLFPSSVVWGIVILAMLVLTGFGILFFFPKKFLQIILVFLKSRGWFPKLQGGLYDCLDGVKVRTGKDLGKILVCSFILIYVNFALLFVVVKSFGFSIPFAQVVLASTTSYLVLLLPIVTVGGYGIFEGGWFSMLFALGNTASVSSVSGILVHTMVLVYTSLAAGMVILIKRVMRLRER